MNEKNTLNQKIKGTPKAPICVSFDIFTGREGFVCPWCRKKVGKMFDRKVCSGCGNPLIWN